MANKNGTVTSRVPNSNNVALDPKVVKFLVAAIISAAVIEVVATFSNKAALVLAGIIVLGLLFNNPFLISAFVTGSRSLQEGLK